MRFHWLILTLLLCGRAAIAQPAQARRILHTFDFEERQLGNDEELPMHWTKVRGPGLPHYVNGHLEKGTAHAGNYSFQFDLNGGSLVYRYAPTQLPVVTGAHYLIQAWCRTTPLAHARARVTAYFEDQDGHILPDTIHYSDLYAAKSPDEPWKLLRMELSADSPKAAWLVLELGLLQPELYAPPALGQRTLHVEDVRGSAWFDDLAVLQVPRVTLSTHHAGNLFRRGDPARLEARIEDRFTEDLAAQFVVRNAEGRNVYQQSGSIDIGAAATIAPGVKRLGLTIPELPAGWYEASLVVSSQGQAVASQSLPFIQFADNAPPGKPDDRFGYIATSLPFAAWDELPQLLPQLSAGRVKLGLWSGAGDVEQMGALQFDTLIQRLEALGITPTACLMDLPPSLVKKINAQDQSQQTAAWENQVPQPAGGLASSNLPLLLRADPALWRPELAYMIAQHANHLDRWQLGPDGTDAFVTDPRMRQVYALLYKEFSRLIKNPDLAMPWPAWYELGGDTPATVALSIPPQMVLPAQLPLYISDLVKNKQARGSVFPVSSAPAHLSLSLKWLDRDRYGREVQIRDLAQRVIYALSAGAQRIDLPLPFNVRRDQSGTLVNEPQEMLLVLRTLMKTLSGATYRGKVPVADGVEAFLFDRDGESVLALWDNGAGGTRELALNLGKRPICMDLWGNATPLLPLASPQSPRDPGAGQVKLKLGSTPILLIDIDGELAMTRASVALDRPLIESSYRPHARRISFTNGYRQAIAGTMHLRAPAGWTLTPPTFHFTLNPGETFDHEVSIEMPYSTTAGDKTLQVEFSLESDVQTHFTVPLTLRVGLSDVGMQTIAMRDGDDLVVQQIVTNYGDQPITYGAFAMYPQQARQERIINALPPGKSTVKRYRFTHIQLMPGVKVRVGVRELEGVRILNDEVPVQ